MIVDLLIICSVILAVSYLLNIVGSSLMSISQINKTTKKSHKKLPFISAVITTNNSGGNVGSCLTSLLATNYRGLEIIVIDFKSTDMTKKVVQNIIRSNPKKQIRFIVKTKLQSNSQLLQFACQQAKGDLILTLSAQSTVDKKALTNAATRFMSDKKLDVLIASDRPVNNHQLAGIFNFYRMQLAKLSIQAQGIFGADHRIGSTVSTFYKTSLLKQVKSENIRARVSFANNSVVYHNPVGVFGLLKDCLNTQVYAFRSLFTASGQSSNLRSSIWSLSQSLSASLVQLANLGMPIILGYFIYLAADLHEPDFLLVSWLALAIYLLFAIYQDDQLSPKFKLAMILLAPTYFIWYYLTLILRYVSFTIAAVSILFQP